MTPLATCIIMAVGALTAMAIGIFTTIALDRFWQRRRWKRKVDDVFRPYEEKWRL